jgi:predicted amidohydrolase
MNERTSAEKMVASALQQMAQVDVVSTIAELTICAVQTKMRQETESPLDASSRILESIKEVSRHTKVDLFVLPELAPVGYCEDTFSRFLPKSTLIKNMYGLIDEAFSHYASTLQCYICYGTIGCIIDEDGQETFTIRQKVVDRTGKVVAVYDKIYLCDYGDCAETRFFRPGPMKPVSFSIDNNFRFGLLLCADMRYPNLSRTLVRDHKVDVLLQPAAFCRDISFPTWKCFRETRAVENSVYFVGVNYAGLMYGESSIVPPWVDDDHRPEVLGTDDDCLICRLLRSELDHARTALPFYRQLCAEPPSNLLYAEK